MLNAEPELTGNLCTSFLCGSINIDQNNKHWGKLGRQVTGKYMNEYDEILCKIICFQRTNKLHYFRNLRIYVTSAGMKRLHKTQGIWCA